MMKTAIVIEDQPAIWDYASHCLKDHCHVLEFCTSTAEAEEAFYKYSPDLVWLDCYLGEVSDSSSGPKNSGIALAAWIKSHKPKTKIFLFTASSDPTILKAANDIRVEGIALGGKFIRDRHIIINGIRAVLAGRNWVSPNVVEDYEMGDLSKITVFEFAVFCSMLLGKSTALIADELDTTRKRVNNAIYRVRQKLEIEDVASKDYAMDLIRDRILAKIKFNDTYVVSDIMAINIAVGELLEPVLNKIKSGELNRTYLDPEFKSPRALVSP